MRRTLPRCKKQLSCMADIPFIGQIDNLLGVKTLAAENAVVKLSGYFRFDYAPNWAAVAIGALCIAIVALWPRKFNARFPGSLCSPPFRSSCRCSTSLCREERPDMRSA